MFSAAKNGDHRLTLWREHRQQCQNLSADQIVEAFGTIAVKPRYLDFYTPESWPCVFEIVREGMFCYSGICLITVATLWHLELTKSQNLQFDVISNHVNGHTGLVFVHQSNCYNFIPGSIVTEQYAMENSTLYDSHIISSDKLFA